MAIFDDILAKIVPDENHRKTVAQIADQYPELKNGWLRNDDYSRKMDEVSGIKKDAEWAQRVKPHVMQWEQWRTEHWDDAAEMTKEEKAARDEAERLLAVVVGKGDDMNFEQMKQYLDKEITTRGIASKADVDKLTTDVTGRAAQLDTSLQGHTYVSLKVPTLVMRAYKEYGDVLDGTELFNKSAEMKEWDLDKVYDAIYKDKSATRKQAELDIIKAEAKKAGYDEAQKELKEKAAGSKDGQGLIPTDQGSGLSGFLQKAVSQEGTDSGYEGMVLGRGAIASKYADEFRKTQG